MLLIFLYQFPTTIRAATIDDNPLEVTPCLTDNRVNRLLQSCLIIVVDGND